MPYIDRRNRKDLDEAIEKLGDLIEVHNEGGVNYCITKLLHIWMGEKELRRYGDYNAAIGILEAAKLELYRDLVGPYEEKAKEQHGEIIRNTRT